MEDLTGRQFGPYQIVAPLGEGGMAAVYKAYQPAMERYVALKVLPRQLAQSDEFIARFQREARLLAQLQHPHILPVFDYGQADGFSYIVMPFVQTGTLADQLTKRRVSLPEVLRIMTQLGDALGYAHARGLIHRDIKPSNVLVDERGNCLLTDFGLARMAEATSRLTSSGAIMGTPAYMSPEQGTGANVDGRSDLYALGIILYEMVTGRVPYTAETPIAIVFKHIQDPLPPVRHLAPDLPEELELVLLKALAKNPADRYQTAEDFVQAIQGALPANSAIRATPASPLKTVVSPPSQPAPQRPASNLPTMLEPVSKPPSSPPLAAPLNPRPVSQPSIRPASQPKIQPTRGGFPIWAAAGAAVVLFGLVGVVVLGLGINYFRNRPLAAEPTVSPSPIALVELATEPVVTAAPTSVPTLTNTPEPSLTPTLPAPPTVAVPIGSMFVRINNISLNDQKQYVVEYETFEYTETLPGTHVHFFFNTVPPEQAGVPGNGPWKLYGGPRPFTGYRPSDRPQNASQLCALVANSNHSVIAESGNCFPLPDVPTATARLDTACLNSPSASGQSIAMFSAGSAILLRGFSSDQAWLAVQNPETVDVSNCWVPFDSSVLAGPLEQVPAINP